MKPHPLPGLTNKKLLATGLDGAHSMVVVSFKTGLVISRAIEFIVHWTTCSVGAGFE